MNKSDMIDGAFALLTKAEAERDALQLQLDIERAVEMAKVIAGLRAQLGEVCEAVKAERVALDIYEWSTTDNGRVEKFGQLMEAKALTDEVVARVGVRK